MMTDVSTERETEAARGARATRHVNGGLRKRCACGRRRWAKCKHPWHFSFFKRTCACPGAGFTCEHAARNLVRVSLHRLAGKPATYWMSKSEAEAWRDRLRGQVREGTFANADAPPPASAPADTRLTVGDVADRYLKTHVRAPGRRPGPIRATEHYLRIMRAVEIPAAHGSFIRLEAKPITEVTKPDIEAVRDARRAQLCESAERRERARRDGTRSGRLVLPGARGGEVGVEHLMGVLRHLFDWAIGEGHLDATPFKRHGRTVIQVRVVRKGRRTRRLSAERAEEARLLEHAGPHLRDLIIAALETGCRRGELLSLQWRQIQWETADGAPTMRFLDLPADKTKTSEPRVIPITARLRAVLERRRLGPDGEPLRADAYVFGDGTGRRIGRVTTAWAATSRRAGIEDLHFHDLRHEFISRMLEAGVPIHKVRDWAGHRDIATTGIYANTTLVHLDEARARFEAHREPPANTGSSAPVHETEAAGSQ